jgi:hypothetical protein
MTKILFLFGIVILVLISSLVFNYKSLSEGFQNLANPGLYPASDDLPLLADSYPYTGSKSVTSNNYQDIWWKYPVFRVGSYAQITNNLKYWENPDDGECIRADFCGALYGDKKIQSNIAQPLPPTEFSREGARVNYYNANTSLFLGPQAGPELPVF